MDYPPLDRSTLHIGRLAGLSAFSVSRLLFIFAVAIRIAEGQTATPAAASKPTPVASTPAPNNTPGPAANAAKQSSSITAMLASVEKQKLSIQSQTGAAGSADSFFTVPWISSPGLPVPNVVPACDPMPEDDLKPLIAEFAKAQDLKVELIRSVIRHESAAYPCAISEKGAVGLMQLMPEVAQQFNVDPLDPRQNIQAGTQYLKQLLTKYKGDLKLTLAAYNAGPQRVDNGNQVPAIPETTAYVDAILKDLTPNTSTPPQTSQQ